MPVVFLAYGSRLVCFGLASESSHQLLLLLLPPLLRALAVLLEAGALLAVAALAVAHTAVRGVADALWVRVTISGLRRQAQPAAADSR